VTETAVTETDRALRRARREFVRAHHPDHGGDPEVFLRGLQAFDRSAGVYGARVVAVRSHGPLWGAALILWRRYRRRQAPARVR
jgi:hypothetical protein